MKPVMLKHKQKHPINTTGNRHLVVMGFTSFGLHVENDFAIVDKCLHVAAVVNTPAPCAYAMIQKPAWQVVNALTFKDLTLCNITLCCKT